MNQCGAAPPHASQSGTRHRKSDKTSAVFFRRARNMERKFLTRGAKRSLLLCLCLCLAAHALALNLPSWRAAPRALFPVSKGGKWGFIDGGGHLVIPLRFDSAAEFSEGLARVTEGGRPAFINAAGEVVFRPRFDTAGDFYEGL